MRSTRSLNKNLATRHATGEKWLMDEVVPTIEAVDSGRMGTVPLKEAFEGFDARIKEIADRK